MSSDDETLDCFAFPFSDFTYVRGEFAYFGYCVDDMRACFDKTPFFSERVDDVVWHGHEGLSGDVETVKVETSFFWSIRKDMFFKRVVTQLI